MIGYIWNSIVDNIPWWVYLVGVIVAAALTYQFWAPIWALLPKPVKIALGAVGAVFVAYIAGRNRGAANARARDKDRADNAVRNRNEVNQRVQNMTPKQVDEELDKKGDFID